MWRVPNLIPGQAKEVGEPGCGSTAGRSLRLGERNWSRLAEAGSGNDYRWLALAYCLGIDSHTPKISARLEARSTGNCAEAPHDLALPQTGQQLAHGLGLPQQNAVGRDLGQRL
jgi:hypothetical protein